MLRLGREEVERYGGVVTRARAAGARVLEPGRRFEVGLGDASRVRARRLLIATGLRDDLPQIDGLAELWGGRVFHCPYCSGCEIGGARVAVLGSCPESVDEAHLLLRYTDNVVLFTNDAVTVSPVRRSAKARLRAHPDVAARHHPDLVSAGAGSSRAAG